MLRRSFASATRFRPDKGEILALNICSRVWCSKNFKVLFGSEVILE